MGRWDIGIEIEVHNKYYEHNLSSTAAAATAAAVAAEPIAAVTVAAAVAGVAEITPHVHPVLIRKLWRVRWLADEENT